MPRTQVKRGRPVSMRELTRKAKGGAKEPVGKRPTQSAMEKVGKAKTRVVAGRKVPAPMAETNTDKRPIAHMDDGTPIFEYIKSEGKSVPVIGYTKAGKPKIPTNPTGAGRPKGSRDQLTTDLKNGVMLAYYRLGGVDWLVKTAMERPELFVNLLGKLLPTELKQEVTLNHQAIIYSIQQGRENLGMEPRRELIDVDPSKTKQS